MKTIVTHFNPDLDALMSVWLIKRFLPEWSEAKVELVPAGQTYKNKPVDNDLEILHVDTGVGKFDHHQTKKNLCAAELVWKEVLAQNTLFSVGRKKLKDWQKKAIQRMLVLVNEDDHALFLAWPEPVSDRWDLGLGQILGGLTGSFKKQEEFVNYALPLIDSLYKIITGKVEAEEIIKNGCEFKTKWGKGIGIETDNAEARHLALKLGYSIIVRKRPKTGHLGIYGNWQMGVNLRKIYQTLKKKDPKADWFYHLSGCMVLNGSTSNPEMKPTKLGLEEVVKILKI